MAIRLDELDLDHDRGLVERYQAGDRSAFDELYVRYFPRLRRYCQSRVRDPHVAEELAQDAFVRALRALPGLGGDRRFYPWMTVIAQRLCIDHLRRAGHTTPRSEIDVGTIDDIEDRVVAQVDLDQLAQALGRVRDRHREVLRLRDWEEMSYEAIAEHLGTPVTTVQSLLLRARRALRREFLAISQASLSTLPLFGGVAVWLRDRRSRAAQWLQWHIPDPAVFGAPIAAATLSVATAFGGPVLPASAGEDATAPASVSAPVPAPSLEAVEVLDLVEAVAEPMPQAAPPQPASAPAMPEAQTQNGPARVLVGPQGARQGREQAEAMPFYAAAGPGYLGAAPLEIVTSSVEGLVGRLGVAR